MAIIRCESAGKYRVDFQEMGWVHGKMVECGPMQLLLHQHPFDVDQRDGSPVISTIDPFEGELCDHELAFLRGFPGKHFNYKWRFTVTQIKGRKGT